MEEQIRKYKQTQSQIKLAKQVYEQAVARGDHHKANLLLNSIKTLEKRLVFKI